MLGNVAVDVFQLTAAQVYEFSAAEALQVEMLHAFLIIFDILIAGAGFAVDDKFPHQSRLHQTVKLAVDRGSTYGSSLRAEICANFLNAGVLLTVADEKVHQLFFLGGIISRFLFQTSYFL